MNIDNLLDGEGSVSEDDKALWEVFEKLDFFERVSLDPFGTGVMKFIGLLDKALVSYVGVLNYFKDRRRKYSELFSRIGASLDLKYPEVRDDLLYQALFYVFEFHTALNPEDVLTPDNLIVDPSLTDFAVYARIGSYLGLTLINRPCARVGSYLDITLMDSHERFSYGKRILTTTSNDLHLDQIHNLSRDSSAYGDIACWRDAIDGFLGR